MKRVILIGLLALAWLALPLAGLGAKPVQVDVLYMNHGPLQPSIKKIKEIFTPYGSRVTVSWYDFETPEGEEFMTKRGVRQHVPLMIWLDGRAALSLEGREVRFVGFPSGSGPLPFQGKWTMEDLRRALDQVTGSK